MNKHYIDELRKKAESLRATTNSSTTVDKLASDIQELVHELEVHEIELQLQHAELRSALEELSNTKEDYVDLFDHAPVGYAVINEQGRVLSLNLTFSKMLGIPRAEIEGQRLSHVIVEADRDTYYLARRSAFTSQLSQTCEVQFMTSNKSIFYGQLDLSLIQTKNICRITCTDITPIKEAEKTTQVALAREKELNELKTRMLQMISHEFRTPLTVMLSTLETITVYGEHFTNEQRQQKAQTIKDYIWYLARLIEEMTNAYNVDNGHVKVNLQKQNCEDMFRKFVEELNDTYPKRIELSVKKTAASPETILFDSDLLKQVLLILVSNSMIYSQGKCTITLTLNTDNFTIEIGDEGVGIPLDDQPFIFDIFFRGDNVKTIHGTGLGLNIAKRLVEACNGTIEFHSEINKGTTFLLTFLTQA